MKAPLQAIVLGTKLSTLFKQIAAQDSVLHISHIIHVNLVLFYHLLHQRSDIHNISS